MENNLGLLANIKYKQGECSESIGRPATSVLLKMNNKRNLVSFEEQLIIRFLRVFNIEHHIELYKVPTWEGSKLRMTVRRVTHRFGGKQACLHQRLLLRFDFPFA
jgi:hypothetical protein